MLAPSSAILMTTNSVDLNVGTLSTSILKFWTNNTERLRFNSSGAIGLSGANYGSAGQVLTSQGSGTAPTWTTPAAGGGITNSAAANELMKSDGINAVGTGFFNISTSVIETAETTLAVPGNDIIFKPGLAYSASTGGGGVILIGGYSDDTVNAGSVFITGGTALGSGLHGNIVLGSTAYGSFQTMQGGIVILNAASAPIGNPSSGFFHWSSSGVPTWRSSAGIIYSFATTSVNAILVNNVTSGGSVSTIADFTSLTVYATDAATIRNNFYRLSEKVLKLETALRALGIAIN